MSNSSICPYQFNGFNWFCLWYPPGWLILFNRHWQHYHDEPEGWNWLEYGLFLIPGGFYLALLLRWLRLGCRSPHRNTEEFYPDYQQVFCDEILDPIMTHYFRVELQQQENIPKNQSLIVAMNHAGMCFPWDFLGLGYVLKKTQGWVVQPLANVVLFEHPWMIWWLPPAWSNVLGGVKAQRDHFEEAVEHQAILLYAPEGVRGAGKSWSKRDQLQPFHPSFIQLSDRYHIPILPVLCLGSEVLHPWAWNVKALAKRVKLPFFPVSPLMIAFILFPSMGVWAMRTRLRYHIQPLEQPEIAIHSGSKVRSQAYQEAQRLRDKLQQQINQHSLRLLL